MTSHKIIIGVDESGRGALAGPLVVAAVAFYAADPAVSVVYKGLRGDKTLTAADSKSFSKPIYREVLDAAIRSSAIGVSVIERSATEIDARLMFTVFNESNKLAISRLLEQMLAKYPDTSPRDYLILMDGDVDVPQGIPCRVETIVDGDKRCWQIGAASIVAKVHCDAKMMALHEKYPKWGFDKHKGYPTPAHKQMLKGNNPTHAHRRTFRPVAESLGLPPGFEG